MAKIIRRILEVFLGIEGISLIIALVEMALIRFSGIAVNLNGLLILLLSISGFALGLAAIIVCLAALWEKYVDPALDKLEERLSKLFNKSTEDKK